MEKSPYLIGCSIIVAVILAFSFIQENLHAQQIKGELEIQANQFRIKNKKDSLLFSPCLDKAAMMQAEYLKDRSDLTHYQNKKETKTPTDRVVLAACPNKIVLENVAYFEYSVLPSPKSAAEQLMELWIKSKGHRLNLVNKYVFKLGTAIVIDTKNKRVIGVQVFTD